MTCGRSFFGKWFSRGSVYPLRFALRRDALQRAFATVAFIIVTAATSLHAGAVQHEATSRPESQPTLTDFERQVRDYLLRNPEVIVEALQKLETRERAAQADEVKRTIALRRDEIFNDPASPVGGNPFGRVTIVEFFDYICPYCRQVAPLLTEAEKANPDLRIVYKEWPILGPGSVFAARAALAAVKQGKYLPFYKAMMQTTGQVNESKALEIAKSIGLDVARLKKDMEDLAIKDAIDRTRKLAMALRITGTPSFVIGDEVVRGAVDAETLKLLIEDARDAARK